MFVVVSGAAFPPLAAHGDFAEQWAAGRIALEGGDPYDTATWRADAARVAGRASDSTAFIYPPYVTFALVPLAALPLDIAATVWLLLSLVVSALGVAALLRAFVPPHALVSFGVGLALFASGASLLALAQGQWGLLLLGILSWSIASIVRGGRASGAAALLLAKPQIAPFVLLALARFATPSARRRYAAGIAVGSVLIATTLIRSDWWREWANASLRFEGQPPIRTATVATLVDGLGAWSVIVVVALFAIVVVVSLRADRRMSLSRWLAAAILIAPYTQAYDHVLLIAPLVTATSGTDGDRGLRTALAATGIFVLIVVDLVIASLTASGGHDVGAAIVPLAIWVIVVASRGRYSPTNF